jgi:hypothetical protein
MRSTARRCLAGLGILSVASVLSMLAPAPAFATCYTVQVGGDGVTVCP